MRTLTQGAGNDEEEAWAVVMSAVGKLFEEYFSPVRGLPISDIPKADTDSISARRFFAKALWSNLQMFELTKELTNSNSGIKNHPIIASAYKEWGLLNSGKHRWQLKLLNWPIKQWRKLKTFLVLCQSYKN